MNGYRRKLRNEISFVLIMIMETFHFQFNLNYNYKSHYYKVICNWLAWFYKKKTITIVRYKEKTEKNKTTKIKTDVILDLSMVYFCKKICST